MLFIFDMGGVVTTTFSMDSLYDELGISKDKFFEICGHHTKSKNDIWYDYQAGHITTDDFWKIFNKRGKKILRKPVDHDLFRLYFHPVLNEKTVELIKALRKKHRVVCGTNTIQSHWENHLERGDYSYFDQTYASNKISEVKPDSEFWSVIMRAEGYSPEETFFTDDREDNCLAAESIGINVVQFKSADDLAEKWKQFI